MKITENIKEIMPTSVKRAIKPIYSKIRKPKDDPTTDPDPRWLTLQNRLAEAEKIIDLGCGNNPVQGATVGIDLYLEPKERGPETEICVQEMKEKGIAFVKCRVDAPLPFADKEFDFAYSHHVFEHLEDPATACEEMMRIAKSGVIITPSIFAELIFGRPYHKWLVMERGNEIFFFRKRPFEDRPFGNHPRWERGERNWVVEDNTNPFDILLNGGEWYHGKERMPRLANILRKHWYSHSPIIEVIFLWDDRFGYFIYE